MAQVMMLINGHTKMPRVAKLFYSECECDYLFDDRRNIWPICNSNEAAKLEITLRRAIAAAVLSLLRYDCHASIY